MLYLDHLHTNFYVTNFKSISIEIQLDEITKCICIKFYFQEKKNYTLNFRYYQLPSYYYQMLNSFQYIFFFLNMISQLSK